VPEVQSTRQLAPGRSRRRPRGCPSGARRGATPLRVGSVAGDASRGQRRHAGRPEAARLAALDTDWTVQLVQPTVREDSNRLFVSRLSATGSADLLLTALARVTTAASMRRSRGRTTCWAGRWSMRPTSPRAPAKTDASCSRGT